MAAAVFSGCDCDRDVAISCSDLGLRNDCWPDRVRRIWIESAEPAAGDARAHRYAARAGNFSDRLADLAKNPSGNRVEIARPNQHLRIAHSRNVDQRPDCLRVSATGNRAV